MRRPLPNALDIDFAGGLTEEVTPHAGVALLVELGACLFNLRLDRVIIWA